MTPKVLIVLFIIFTGIVTNVFSQNTKFNADSYKDHPRLQRLIKKLKTGDKSNKYDACFSLSELGNKRAIVPIAEFLNEQDINNDKEKPIGGIISCFGNFHNKEALAYIVKFIKLNKGKLDPNIIDEVVIALGKAPDKKYKVFLLELLKSDKINMNKRQTHFSLFYKVNAAHTLAKYYSNHELWNMANDNHLQNGLKMVAICSLGLKGDKRVKKNIMNTLDIIESFPPLVKKRQQIQYQLFQRVFGYELLEHYSGDIKVQNFLLNKLSKTKGFAPYIIQAIGRTCNADAVVPLKKHYDEIKKTMIPDAFSDYIIKALFNLSEQNFIMPEIIRMLKSKEDGTPEMGADVLYDLCQKGYILKIDLTKYILEIKTDADVKHTLALCMMYCNQKLDNKTRLALFNKFKKCRRSFKFALASLLLSHNIESEKVVKIMAEIKLIEKYDWSDGTYEFTKALATYKGDQIDEMLMSLLRNHINSKVREQAAKSLSGRKSKAVREALRYADKYETYPNVRKAIKQSIQQSLN